MVGKCPRSEGGVGQALAVAVPSQRSVLGSGLADSRL